MPNSKKISTKKGRRQTRRRGPRSLGVGVNSVAFSSTVGQGLERKFWSYPLKTAFSSVSTTPQNYPMTSGIVAGTTYNGRIGNSIRLIGISAAGTIEGGQLNLATDDEFNTVRFSVILGNWTVLNANITPAMYSVNSVLDPRILFGLRKIIYDRIFNLVTPGRDSTGYLPGMKQMSFKLPIREVINYMGAGGNADMEESVILLCVTDSTLASHPGFVNGVAVLEYEDI